MNQKLHPEQIGQLLNRSLNRLDQPTLAQLHHARAQALARYDSRITAPAFAWAGSSAGAGRIDSPLHKFHYFAAAVLFATVVYSGVTYWHHEHDLSEVDVAILTDELPIEVYVD